MKSGLYALASLDGSPLKGNDLEILGLTARPGDATASAVRVAPGIAARGCENPLASPALHFGQTPETLLAFAGYLDEPEELAARLGMAANVPSTIPAAELARRALDRFGAEAPLRMLGEWSLLRWTVQTRELTLLCSEALRDHLFWASDGKQVAVAPDLLRLGKLPWVGLSLDRQGVALGLSRAGLRRIRDRDTVWKGIYAAPPGTREVFAQGSRQTVAPAPEPEPMAWQGSFEEAIEALNALGQRIVGQNVRRYRSSGFLLSGGLDSALITVLGAQEREPGREMFCLTSVAPEGSGLPDEREFSAAVAGQLGLRVRLVAPAPEARVYRPAPGEFSFHGHFLPASRHYLYEALQRAAQAEGAGALFDGVMGEMSITEKPGAERVDWFRRQLYAWREWNKARRRRAQWPAAGFHVRFAPELLGQLPGEWRPIWQEGMPQRRRLAPDELRGVHPAVSKGNSMGTLTPQGLRRLFPFRDRRLLRFAAGLPFGFGEQGGETRAMARAMLRGRVPENVRLRPRGMPFSPDYIRRMNGQAAEARERIGLFREAGADRWLDLAWLDSALERLAAGADPYAEEQLQAQPTAMAGEFFVWCREQGIKI